MGKLKLLALSTLVILSPIKAVVITTLIMVFADLITGILAAYKRKEPITSAGFKRTVIKIFVYEVALVLGFITETYMTGSAIALSKIVSTFIGITELKSVSENLNEISGGSLLKVLIQKLGSPNAQP